MIQRKPRDIARLAIHIVDWIVVLVGVSLIVVGMVGAQWYVNGNGAAFVVLGCVGTALLAGQATNVWLGVGVYIGVIHFNDEGSKGQ